MLEQIIRPYRFKVAWQMERGEILRIAATDVDAAGRSVFDFRDRRRNADTPVPEMREIFAISATEIKYFSIAQREYIENAVERA